MNSIIKGLNWGDETMEEIFLSEDIPQLAMLEAMKADVPVNDLAAFLSEEDANGLNPWRWKSRIMRAVTLLMMSPQHYDLALEYSIRYKEAFELEGEYLKPIMRTKGRFSEKHIRRPLIRDASGRIKDIGIVMELMSIHECKMSVVKSCIDADDIDAFNCIQDCYYKNLESNTELMEFLKRWPPHERIAKAIGSNDGSPAAIMTKLKEDFTSSIEELRRDIYNSKLLGMLPQVMDLVIQSSKNTGFFAKAAKLFAYLHEQGADLYPWAKSLNGNEYAYLNHLERKQNPAADAIEILNEIVLARDGIKELATLFLVQVPNEIIGEHPNGDDLALRKLTAFRSKRDLKETKSQSAKIKYMASGLNL
ncbi:hypothetical protein ACYPKM_05410 [Pseudomonas aeruginosa]